MPDSRPVAGIVTVYRRHSHADVILTKLLEGPNYDGKNLFPLSLKSVYIDQFPKNDIGRELAKKYGFKICETIDEALTLGTGKLAIDGVLNIGEHGDYPKSEIGQIQYPRRRFFEEVCKTLARTKRIVPVLNDKHLAANWDDAKWMYDRARELAVPFMAGSTIPLTWRKPDLKLPKNSRLTEAVMLGYGPMEGYGYHALEGMQCMAERRVGGETGVKSVQALTGPAMWKACDEGRFSKALLEETLKLVTGHAPGDYRTITEKTKDASIWVIDYHDGLKAAVAMLNGYLYEGDGGAFIFAGSITGQAKPVSCQFYLQQPDPFAHFGELIKAFEFMVRTNHPAYPIERTLLTTGMLHAAMQSLHMGGKKIDTPHLKISYQPTEWSHATGPIPNVIKR